MLFRSLAYALISLGVLYGLQFPYMAFFTSSVIAPFPPKQIQTNRELLLESGFRALSCSQDDANLLLRTLRTHPAPAREFPPAFVDRLRVELGGAAAATVTPPYCSWAATGLLAARNADRGAVLIESHFEHIYASEVATAAATGQFGANHLHCQTVARQTWDSAQWVTINWHGHLEEAFRSMWGAIQGAGVYELWERVYMEGTMREAKKMEEAPTSQDLSLSLSEVAPTWPLFKLCLVGLGASVAGFWGEMAWFWGKRVLRAEIGRASCRERV